ncbi:MAG: hypothetical protein AYP45_06490 [Candidatus Brocadia carolinensis]|uniref:Uncharacterized protein n=1 Tax=Candidatus Brocadia carolinensis TaxID=1004156 RepID=A0A1V4AUT4_9BACT|nr:MAG: hypothetical protein AYP45_06490 [Candidatus Brocadia caroliniensis]
MKCTIGYFPTRAGGFQAFFNHLRSQYPEVEIVVMGDSGHSNRRRKTPGVFMSKSIVRGERWKTGSRKQQLPLFADRASTETMRANQLRLWASSVAYVLLNK